MCLDVTVAFKDVNDLDAIINVSEKDRVSFEDRTADIRAQLWSRSAKHPR